MFLRDSSGAFWQGVVSGALRARSLLFVFPAERRVLVGRGGEGGGRCRSIELGAVEKEL